MAKAKSSTPKKRKTDAAFNPRKLTLAIVAAFVITFLYDWLVHGKLLMASYKATASMWRPEAQMQAMMHYCIAKHILQAILFSGLLLHWKCSQTIGAVFSAD